MFSVCETGLECHDEIIGPTEGRVSIYARLNPISGLVELTFNDTGLVLTIPELSVKNLRQLRAFFGSAYDEFKGRPRGSKAPEVRS